VSESIEKIIKPMSIPASSILDRDRRHAKTQNQTLRRSHVVPTG
jgi:hypothetical protein